jgi:23S rRNA (adenine2503-C2)-methyltransferase
MGARGEPPYRGDQIFRWIHARGVVDPDGMTDLSKALRQSLREEGLGAVMHVERIHRSDDDTRKLLVRMNDDMAVETVLLPVSRSDDADAAALVEDDEEPPAPAARVTQCISSQVGCALGCIFCASGIAGLKRHMTAAEIVSQVLIGRSKLENGELFNGIVFMGMGEPLHNYDAVARAIRLMTHPDGLGLSPRRITVSTSGLVPEMDRLGEDFEGSIGLALSLHNADDEKRSALMPINNKYPLKELMAALRRYPMKRRPITIEYTLVAGQNDTLGDARAVAHLLKGLKVKINLIPMNPIEHSKLGPPAMDTVHAFQRVLTDAGYRCFVRRRRGDDVSAACGQLVLLGAKPTGAFQRRQPSDKND